MNEWSDIDLINFLHFSCEVVLEGSEAVIVDARCHTVLMVCLLIWCSVFAEDSLRLGHPLQLNT